MVPRKFVYAHRSHAILRNSLTKGKRGRICDVTTERGAPATQFELPMAGIGIHPTKANNEDPRVPTRFHEVTNT